MINIYSPYEIDIEQLSSNQKDWEIFASKFTTSSVGIKDILLLSAPPYLWSLGIILKLTESQSADLSRIVRDILFGDIFINDMTNNISEKLNIDQQTALQIRNRIANELFAPAIEDIKKIQREKFPDRVGQGSASTMPQPPAPPQMKNTPPVNQGNVINLRQNSNS